MLLNKQQKRETGMTLEVSATTLINRQQCGHTYQSERAEDCGEEADEDTHNNDNKNGTCVLRELGVPKEGY